MTGDNIVTIMLAIITILGTVVTSVLVPYLKLKLTAKQREAVEFWTTQAVAAAQQMYQATANDTERHYLKKKFVLDFLKLHGIDDLTEEDLDVLIEAAVQELNLSIDALKEFETE